MDQVRVSKVDSWVGSMYEKTWLKLDSLSFLLFLFQFSLFLVLVTIPHSIYGYYSYLYWFQPVEFLYFTLIAYQPFLFAMSTLLELPTSAIVVRPPLLIDMLSAFSLFHYLFHNKSLPVLFCQGSISHSGGQNFEFLSTYFYGMHQVVLDIYYLF